MILQEARMKPFINNYEDIMELLDSQIEGLPWNTLYTERNKPAPFLLQNDLPDENLVEFLETKPHIESAIEFGCGEGRNSIYMAKQGIAVTAIDISDVAISNAKENAANKEVQIDFQCKEAFKTDIKMKFDFAYDSGMFHHLAPHRRITYINLLKTILNDNGYFGLVCFAWGENVAGEIDDWEFYQQKWRGEIAFTKERLIDLFTPNFEIIEIRKYKSGIPNTIQGLDFLWTCLFRNN